MRKVRKFILVTGLLSLLTMGFVGCGFEKCDLCLEKKFCDEYTIAFETFTMCDDCHTAWVNGTPLVELLRYE